MKLWILSLLMVVSLFATDAKKAATFLNVENNFLLALTKAKSEKKMLILVVVKENCRWCDKLIYKTLSDPEVKNILGNYITVVVNNHDDFPKDFKESFFPALFYIDENTGESLYENVGFVGKKCFLKDLKESKHLRDEFNEE